MNNQQEGREWQLQLFCLWHMHATHEWLILCAHEASLWEKMQQVPESTQLGMLEVLSNIFKHFSSNETPAVQ